MNKRFLELGNNVYIVFGDDGFMYLGARVSTQEIVADVSRKYNRMHSYKEGVMLLNDSTEDYVCVANANGTIMFGNTFIAVDTDVFTKVGVFTMEHGILTDEDAVIYAVKRYGDEDYIHNLIGMLLGGKDA